MLKNDAKTAQISSKDHKTARTRAKTTLKEQNMLFVPLDRHQKGCVEEILPNFAKLDRSGGKGKSKGKNGKSTVERVFRKRFGQEVMECTKKAPWLPKP